MHPPYWDGVHCTWLGTSRGTRLIVRQAHRHYVDSEWQQQARKHVTVLQQKGRS